MKILVSLVLFLFATTNAHGSEHWVNATYITNVYTQEEAGSSFSNFIKFKAENLNTYYLNAEGQQRSDMVEYLQGLVQEQILVSIHVWENMDIEDAQMADQVIIEQ